VETATITIGRFRFVVALDAGPRILEFARAGGPSLFAAVDVVLESDAGRLELLGGHRLWRAPEIPAVSWEPDDRPIDLERFDGGFRLTGASDRDGVVKTIEVRDAGAFVTVDHQLANRSAATVRCAPWAITQLAPGGLAVVPQPVGDPADVRPDRTVVLWPYTDPAGFAIGQTDIRIDATDAPRAKMGQPNRRGWMAYTLDDEVFVKWSPLHDDGRDYADLGASIQCYRDQHSLELESLGPLTDLAPGDEVVHREVWELMSLEGRTLDGVLATLPLQRVRLEPEQFRS
jgi:hypothetical protein